MKQAHGEEAGKFDEEVAKIKADQVSLEKLLKGKKEDEIGQEEKDKRTELTKQIEETEELANKIVFENRPVQISFRPSAEANQMDLRKPAFREGDIRVVEVEGFDLSACGGTHVIQTGAIGLISIRKVDTSKGLTRVAFVCGGRGLRRAPPPHDSVLPGRRSARRRERALNPIASQRRRG